MAVPQGLARHRVDGNSLHQLGVKSTGGNLFTRQDVHIGEGGRPLYKDYFGDYIAYDQEHYQWHLGTSSAFTPTEYTVFTPGFGGAEHFCPTTIPKTKWSTSTTELVELPACLCTQIADQQHRHR